MIRFLSGQTEVFQINALSPLNKKNDYQINKILFKNLFYFNIFYRKLNKQKN